MSFENNKKLTTFLNYLRSWDSFGRQVGLTINGDSAFKTLYGSMATLALTIYIAKLFLTRLVGVVGREIDSTQF